MHLHRAAYCDTRQFKLVYHQHQLLHCPQQQHALSACYAVADGMSWEPSFLRLLLPSLADVVLAIILNVFRLAGSHTVL